MSVIEISPVLSPNSKRRTATHIYGTLITPTMASKWFRAPPSRSSMPSVVWVPGRSTLPDMKVLLLGGLVGAKIKPDVSPHGSGVGAVVKAVDLRVRCSR